MIKGYIFKAHDMWKWGQMVQLTVDEALFEVQGEYNTWDEALHSLIVAQLEAQ